MKLFVGRASDEGGSKYEPRNHESTKSRSWGKPDCSSLAAPFVAEVGDQGMPVGTIVMGDTGGA